LEHYQRLVCQAKVEIGDTHYMQAKYEEAAECYQRMIKDEFPWLNKGAIHYKWIRCLANLNRHADVVAQARFFLDRFPETAEQPEVRFLLANAHKQLGHIPEALQQVLLLLQSQTRQAAQNPENWVYWQQRAGNEIANQLYKEGDYLNALNIYLSLVQLDASPAWQLPVGYQIGMVYEHLNQPQKAIQVYLQLLSYEKELGTNASPGLRAVLDMAKWRQEFLSWQIQAEQSNHDYRLVPPSASAVPPAK
jgi:tetratricopeptide (TPR) repeat protein